MYYKKNYLNDFKQKVRNRPIQIEDIAISKIRRVRFEGFTDDEEKFIQDMHKQVLKEAQMLNKQYRTNTREAGILINLRTNAYWIIHGKKDREVNMKDNEMAYYEFCHAGINDLMFIHNHPSTGTFSGQDFIFFCTNKQIGIVDVVGNDGTIYVLRKTPDFDESVLLEYGNLALYYKNKGHIQNNGTLAMRDILRQAASYGLMYKKGSHKS